MRVFKKDEAVKQWKNHAHSIAEEKKQNDSRQSFHVRTSFAIAAAGVGLIALAVSLSPELTLPIAVISGSLFGVGLTAGMSLYTFHALKNVKLNHGIKYCRAREMDLVETENITKGKVVEDYEDISTLVKKEYEKAGKNYASVVRKEAFKSQDIKIIYGLSLGTIMASVIGMAMMLNKESVEVQTPPLGTRQEELEGNSADTTSSEVIQSQPRLPNLAH